MCVPLTKSVTIVEYIGSKKQICGTLDIPADNEWPSQFQRTVKTLELSDFLKRLDVDIQIKLTTSTWRYFKENSGYLS